MPFDRFMIAPMVTGWKTDLRPWLIPDDAFPELDNAYVFRGRVRKRFGGTLTGNGATSAQIAPYFSRVKVQVGTTDGAGNITTTVPGFTAGTFGQAFTIGNEIFTVPALGTPVVMLDTGASTVHTFNTTTGQVIINGALANTAVYYYPGLPIMGLDTYDKAGVSVNDQPAYAFDTRFAYLFNNGQWTRSGAPIWHGDNSNFFWTANWRGAVPQNRALFVTNYFTVNPNGPINANDDPIWYTQDGTNWTAAAGANAFYYAPNGGAPHTGPYVLTARLIVGFKDRLVLLNTIEVLDGANNTQFVNRARWSHAGDPFATNAWYELNQTDNAGTPTSVADGGGQLPAPTSEAIVSCEFIKDRLIVYFESSTYELAWTGNTALPFQWQKINTELGSEATFSTVPFDKHILTMGNVGVHACNGSNVDRIDDKIPDEIFKIRNKNVGVQRVAGIRDYFTEMVYWTFPSDNQTDNSTYPNKVLVYNYRNGSWALNDDCITVFGYFNQDIDQTWATDQTLTWEQANWAWNDSTNQAQFRQVIAGNQQGYIFIVDSERSRNAPVMQISAMTNVAPPSENIQLTVLDHNLEVGEYVALENAGGLTGGFTQLNNFPVIRVVDANTIQLGPVVIDFGDEYINISPQFTGTYTGGGSLTRVSNIGILSKEFNPYVDQDRSVYVQKIDFCVANSPDGEVYVEFYTSSSNLPLVREGIGTEAQLGTNVLETGPYAAVPYEQTQARLWHPVYFLGSGEFVQIFIFMNSLQMPNRSITWANFELEAMTLYTRPMSYRLQ